MFYKVGLELKDGTILEAIVKADSEENAKVRALSNLKLIDEYAWNHKYYNYYLGLITKIRNESMEVINTVKLDGNTLDELGYFEDTTESVGANNYEVLLFDAGGLFNTHVYSVHDNRYAYVTAVEKFYRKDLIEGFIYKLEQPYKVGKKDKHEIWYTLKYKEEHYQLIMSEYHDFSTINMLHYGVVLGYVGPNLTIEGMLNKLSPQETIETKVLNLFCVMLGKKMTEIYTDFYIYKPEICESKERDLGSFDLPTLKKCLSLNYKNLADLGTIDMVSDWQEAETNCKRVKEFIEDQREQGRKLYNFYSKYEDIMTEKQKEVLLQMGKEFDYTVFSEWSLERFDKSSSEWFWWNKTCSDDAGWGSISSSDECWGSPFENNSEHIEEPTKPKKSRKVTTKQSKGSKKSSK